MRRLIWLAFFITYPILEILTIAWVGAAVGWGSTVLLLLAGFICGLLIMRSAGTAAFAALTGWTGPGITLTDPETGDSTVIHTATDPERTPEQAGRELTESAILFAGGGLIAAPGFLNDLAGLVLVLPPVRAFVARRFAWNGSRGGVVIEGEAVVIDEGGVIRGQILPPKDGGASPIV